MSNILPKFSHARKKPPPPPPPPPPPVVVVVTITVVLLSSESRNTKQYNQRKKRGQLHQQNGRNGASYTSKMEETGPVTPAKWKKRGQLHQQNGRNGASYTSKNVRAERGIVCLQWPSLDGSQPRWARLGRRAERASAFTASSVRHLPSATQGFSLEV